MSRRGSKPRLKIDGLIPMKKGKKRKKRQRSVASRKRVENQAIPISGQVFFPHHNKEKQKRLKELEDENRHIFEKVISRYELSSDDVALLEHEFKLGLSVIADFEDATFDELEDLWLLTYESEPLSEMVDDTSETDEASWRASFELSNELGLSMINIDDDGNITGEGIEY